MHNANRLVLGTAQLGMPYGIANATGQPDFRTAQEIVKTAWENGICEFDTAQRYGKSEEVLGRSLSKLEITQDALVLSKFDPGLDHLNREELSIALDESLARLHISRLAGIMLHREEHLDLWEKGLGEILISFVKDGRADRIGISVYSPQKALQALRTNGVDVVQFPTNLLDRKFVDAGIFDLAERMGKQLYIRSIFLQGLLLIEPQGLSTRMQFAQPVLEKLVSLAKEFGMTRQELALAYVKKQFPKAKIIFGAELVDQIEHNVDCWNSNVSQTFVKRLHQDFRRVDEKILNPVLWQNGS